MCTNKVRYTGFTILKWTEIGHIMSKKTNEQGRIDILKKKMHYRKNNQRLKKKI